MYDVGVVIDSLLPGLGKAETPSERRDLRNLIVEVLEKYRDEPSFDYMKHMRHGGKIARPEWKEDGYYISKHETNIPVNDSSHPGTNFSPSISTMLKRFLIDVDDWIPYDQPLKDILENGTLYICNFHFNGNRFTTILAWDCNQGDDGGWVNEEGEKFEADVKVKMAGGKPVEFEDYCN